MLYHSLLEAGMRNRKQLASPACEKKKKKKKVADGILDYHLQVD